MTRPWTTLDRFDTPDGPIELRRRGDADFLITVDGRVLMTSSAHRSERALAELALAGVTAPRPRILVGGLGMGYTLRATLDHAPPAAELVVVELHTPIVDWCRGPLAPLTAAAVADPRVRVEIGDVAAAIADAAAGRRDRFDAILLDLYEGPHLATQGDADPFYGRRALAATRAALSPGGVLAVWSEDPDAAFEARLAAAGFTARRHRPGRGGRSHAVYVARIPP
jgi:spermidine synthase